MGSLVSERPPRILYIDAFDSFANNITGLLEQRLGAEVTLVHVNDAIVDSNFEEILAAVDAVVVGPGPGHPANPNDVGFIDKLWTLDEANLVPVLGICLGFQSLCLHHGASVERLQRPRHGIVTRVSHQDKEIFADLGELEATQYHSLHANNGGVGDDKAAVVSWEPTKKCPALQPLAWDEADEINGPLLMGVRHTTKPFWGVQFHPESICTTAAGAELIANWWARARDWLLHQGRTRTEVPLTKWVPPKTHVKSSGACVGSHLAKELRSTVGSGEVVLRWERYPTAQNLGATALLNALGYRGEEVILLDSQGRDDVGRFDILGLVIPGQTMKVTYKVSDRTLRYGSEATQEGMRFSAPLNSIDEIWPMLQEALDLHAPRNNEADSDTEAGSPENLDLGRSGLPQDIPFWGGFMGYISYEAGLETIDVEPHKTSGVPDINFAFVHRSIVIDHATCHVYVQSLLPSDREWIIATGNTIRSLTNQQDLPTPHPSPNPSLASLLSLATVERPPEKEYRAKIAECQTYLHSGDSYELCLTDASTISLPKSEPWSWYGDLRIRNPAPHGAYLNLSGVTVLSSSPERFLRWTRSGVCEFRPIKGTVKKSRENPITREEAEKILGTAKERAENLMIVDLIRHDLAGAVGGNNVWVSQLMEVEEFATVWHLVSVIQGNLSGPSSTGTGNEEEEKEKRSSGIDVLSRSLPPGSMTGAPKKRSCEILSRIEGQPRGVYSGVLGYLDVGGGGDFSVIIRTAVKLDVNLDSSSSSSSVNGNGNANLNLDDGHGEEKGEIWRVGAGGAITVQSDEEGEFLEMETKASSVLDALLRGVKM